MFTGPVNPVGKGQGRGARMSVNKMLQCVALKKQQKHHFCCHVLPYAALQVMLLQL